MQLITLLSSYCAVHNQKPQAETTTKGHNHRRYRNIDHNQSPQPENTAIEHHQRPQSKTTTKDYNNRTQPEDTTGNRASLPDDSFGITIVMSSAMNSYGQSHAHVCVPDSNHVQVPLSHRACLPLPVQVTRCEDAPRQVFSPPSAHPASRPCSACIPSVSHDLLLCKLAILQLLSGSCYARGGRWQCRKRVVVIASNVPVPCRVPTL
eukprot:181739-Chlamydomonas_euryale.AAC.3